jgi:hypothetical protein
VGIPEHGDFVMNRSTKVIAVALLAAASPWLVAPVGAVPLTPLAGLQSEGAPRAESVQYRRGYRGGGGWRGGRGAGIGAGLVAGAIIGGAIATSRPYGYGYGPSYGYGAYAPAYVDDGYVDEGYVAVAPGGGGGSAAAYCAQRYRSYDPRSGTFLGYDGLRHPCP